MANENDLISMKEMMDALEGSLKRIEAGDIVKGKVISVTKEEIFVNISYMADGIITAEEYSDEEVNLLDEVKAGDEIEALILKVNDGEGCVQLSKKQAQYVKVWDIFEDSLTNSVPFDVKIEEIVKGGVITTVSNVRCFIPASQLSLSYVDDLKQFLGKKLSVIVIELVKEKHKVVLSHKELLKKENGKKKKIVFETIKVGEKMTGTVKRLTSFGAFVDLGGVDGLIFNDNLSWKRVNDPKEVVSVGDKVLVYVISFDKEKEKISLGLKEVSENPWLNIENKYHVSDIVEGTVQKVLDFGAFIEIEPGLLGLVHVSNISDEKISKPSNVLKINDVVKCKILEIDTVEEKLSLSIKDAKEDELSKETCIYNSSQDTEVTIGDLLKDKLKGFKFE